MDSSILAIVRLSMESNRLKNTWPTRLHAPTTEYKRRVVMDAISRYQHPDVFLREMRHVEPRFAPEPTDVIIEDKLPETATDESLD